MNYEYPTVRRTRRARRFAAAALAFNVFAVAVNLAVILAFGLSVLRVVLVAACLTCAYMLAVYVVPAWRRMEDLARGIQAMRARSAGPWN
jgi:uncharacterized membrane protein (DUF485 family)